MREPIYIVDGVRTPFAKSGPILADTPATALGKIVISLLIAKTGLPLEQTEEVFFGCVGHPVEAPNIARVFALRAGIPESVPGVTVHRNCASGFEAVTQAAEKMIAGRGDVFVVGCVESMSQMPLLYSYDTAKKFGAYARAKDISQKVQAASRFRLNDLKPTIALQVGLSDPVCGLSMGETAENVSRDFNITREEQDSFAMRSHHRAIAARSNLDAEITPVYLPKSKNGKVYLQEDNGPRENQTMEALAKLRPVFEPNTGTVTAGNSSQITDGAAGLLFMTGKGVKEAGLAPFGRLLRYEYVGVDTARMGLGPVHAINRAGQKSSLGFKDASPIRLNETFS